MKKKTFLGLFVALSKITFKAFAFLSCSSSLVFMSARAQIDGMRELPQERELYNTIPGSEQKGSILDATNPMELMNILRRATSMDDATSPSDAVDEALRSFEFEGEDNSSLVSDY